MRFRQFRYFIEWNQIGVNLTYKWFGYSTKEALPIWEIEFQFGPFFCNYEQYDYVDIPDEDLA